MDVEDVLQEFREFRATCERGCSKETREKVIAALEYTDFGWWGDSKLAGAVGEYLRELNDKYRDL